MIERGLFFLIYMGSLHPILVKPALMGARHGLGLDDFVEFLGA